MMAMKLAALVALSSLAFAPLALQPAVAQGAQSAQAATPLKRAIEIVQPKNQAKLKVWTPSFHPGSDIPFENTQWAGNIFPGLSWEPGPQGTQSYAIIMQDTDGMRPTGPIIVLHWTMFNIPAHITDLPRGMADNGLPNGASYGPNARGAAQPYMGPRTPSGPKHHYYLQLFALDSKLPATDNLTYEQLLANMQGHVLQSGEVYGMGQSPYPAE